MFVCRGTGEMNRSKKMTKKESLRKKTLTRIHVRGERSCFERFKRPGVCFDRVL